MRTAIITAALAILLVASDSRAQDSCPPNQKQLAVAQLTVSYVKFLASGEPVRADQGELLLCGSTAAANQKLWMPQNFRLTLDGLESSEAKVAGCSPGIVERGFGAQPRISTRTRPDGVLEISVTSRREPRCVVTAVWNSIHGVDLKSDARRIR